MKNKIIGILLIALAILTVAGMIMNNNRFWITYNYIALAISIVGGIALLKDK